MLLFPTYFPYITYIFVKFISIYLFLLFIFIETFYNIPLFISFHQSGQAKPREQDVKSFAAESSLGSFFQYYHS